MWNVECGMWNEKGVVGIRVIERENSWERLREREKLRERERLIEREIFFLIISSL